MEGKTGPLPGIDLEHYVRLLLRQKWFVMMPALVGVLGMGIFSLTLTNQYRATSTVLVEPQALPKRYLEATVSYGPEIYVRTLVEQVKSVSRLEQVINEFDLYADMRRRGKTLEEIVAYMRDHIEIVRRGSDTFSITFTGEDPLKVQGVTNRLADLFIEENIKFRLLKSENNVKLLEGQAKKLRAEVMVQERQIEAFKQANIGRLPDQQQTVQIQLSAAQRQLDATLQSLVAARIRAANLREKLNSLKPIVITRKPAAASEDRKALEKARKELASLTVQYSDRHPDVKLKQAEVEALERRVAAEEDGSSAPPKRRVVYTSEHKRTEEELRLVEETVTRLEAEEERVKQRIEDLNERLEAMPLVALKLSELSNGLEVKRDQADAYQKKATDAMASLAMERNNQGSQFRSLDRARVPTKPVSPNRPVLIVIGAIVGLIVGIIIMVGLDILFRPFLDEQDLARFTGVQVLVSIPQVGPFPSEWERFRGQVSNLTRFLLGSLSLVDETYHAPTMVAPGGAQQDGPHSDRDAAPSRLPGTRRLEARTYAPPSQAVHHPPWATGHQAIGHRLEREALRSDYGDPAGPYSRRSRTTRQVRRPMTQPGGRQGNGRIEYSSETFRRDAARGALEGDLPESSSTEPARPHDGAAASRRSTGMRRPRAPDQGAPQIRIVRSSEPWTPHPAGRDPLLVPIGPDQGETGVQETGEAKAAASGPITGHPSRAGGGKSR